MAQPFGTQHNVDIILACTVHKRLKTKIADLSFYLWELNIYINIFTKIELHTIHIPLCLKMNNIFLLSYLYTLQQVFDIL